MYDNIVFVKLQKKKCEFGSRSSRANLEPDLIGNRTDIFISHKTMRDNYFYDYVLEPISRKLVQYVKPYTSVYPNDLTLLSVLLLFMCFASGSPPLLILGSLLYNIVDSMDGILARETEKKSPHGHICDHGLDLLTFIYTMYVYAKGDPAAAAITAFTDLAFMFTNTHSQRIPTEMYGIGIELFHFATTIAIVVCGDFLNTYVKLPMLIGMTIAGLYMLKESSYNNIAKIILCSTFIYYNPLASMVAYPLFSSHILPKEYRLCEALSLVTMVGGIIYPSMQWVYISVYITIMAIAKNYQFGYRLISESE